MTASQVQAGLTTLEAREVLAAMRKSAPKLGALVETCGLARKPFADRTSSKPIVIAGHPREWQRARRELFAEGFSIKGYLDWRGRHEGDEYKSRPVYRSAAYVPEQYDVVFFGSPRKADFLCSPPSPQRCYWRVPPQGWRLNIDTNRRDLITFAREYGEVFDGLSDDASRRTLASIVRARLESNSGYLRIANYREYHHPGAAVQPGDVVIDGGSFDGASSIEFALRTGPLGRVFAMEPDPQNFLRVVGSTSNHPNIIPCAFGLWGRHQVLRFNQGGGGSSAIEDGGDVEVVVTTVDQIVKTHRLNRLDLIKLDVEGAEAQALHGAKLSIKHLRPKLHVSIYHKPRDLFQLPLQLMHELEDYCFFIGHHNFYHTETDLYAVPRERLSKNQNMALNLTSRISTITRYLPSGLEARKKPAQEVVRDEPDGVIHYRHGIQVSGSSLVTLGTAPQTVCAIARLYPEQSIVSCSTVAEVDLFMRSNPGVKGIYVWGPVLDNRITRYFEMLRPRSPIFLVLGGPLYNPDVQDLSPWSLLAVPLTEGTPFQSAALLHAEVDRALAQRTSELETLGSEINGLLMAHGVEQYGYLTQAAAPVPGLRPENCVLVLDDEPSVNWGTREQLAFLVRVAQDYPGHELLFRPHPTRREVSPEIQAYCRVVSQYRTVLSLVRSFRQVAVHRSFAGFEALRAGAQVRTYGAPFYAGRGLTEDVTLDANSPAALSGLECTLNELCAIVYGKLARYVPRAPSRMVPATTDFRMTVEQWSAARSDAERRRVLGLPLASRVQRRTAFAFSVGPKWRQAVERLLPEYHFVFLEKPGYKKAVEELLAKDPNLEAVLWGFFQPKDFEQFAAKKGIPIRRFEDGFLRSVGTGKDVDAWGRTNFPLSLTLDCTGIYYDRRSPSDVELLLANYPFDEDPWLLRRARSCIDRINELRLTKYNTTNQLRSKDVYGPKNRYRILVVGQVEQDRSIQFGCSQPITNNDVVRAARRDFPDAQILYKPHPVVLRKWLPSISDPNEVTNICEIVTDDMSLPDALVDVDHLYTMTSGSGIEALLRGIRVTTFGANFYAGWGLTDDRDPVSRRSRRLSLEALFAGFYILHTRYYDHRSNCFISIEEAIELLARHRRDHVGVEDYNRALRLEAEGELDEAGTAARRATELNSKFPNWYEAALRISWKSGDERRARELAEEMASKHLRSVLSELTLAKTDLNSGGSIAAVERTLQGLASEGEKCPLVLLTLAECRFLKGENESSILSAFSRCREPEPSAEVPSIWLGPKALFWAARAASIGNDGLVDKLLRWVDQERVSLPKPLFLEARDGASWASACLSALRTRPAMLDESWAVLELSFDESTGEVNATNRDRLVCSFLPRPRLYNSSCVIQQSLLYRPIAGWREFSFSVRHTPMYLLPLAIEQGLARRLDRVPGLVVLACAWLAHAIGDLRQVTLHASARAQLTPEEATLVWEEYGVRGNA